MWRPTQSRPVLSNLVVPMPISGQQRIRPLCTPSPEQPYCPQGSVHPGPADQIQAMVPFTRLTNPGTHLGEYAVTDLALTTYRLTSATTHGSWSAPHTEPWPSTTGYSSILDPRRARNLRSRSISKGALEPHYLEDIDKIACSLGISAEAPQDGSWS